MRVFVMGLLVMAIGCGTAQTQATKHIDEIMKSGALDRSDPMGFVERQHYKAVYMEASGEITALTAKVAKAEKRADDAEKKAERNARLARQAIILWIVLGSCAALFMFCAIRAAARRLVDPG